MTYREPTGEAMWANTDPSLHYNHSEPEVADWRQEYIRLLKIKDYEAAELLKSRNMVSDECVNGDHDLCHYTWCQDVCHSAVQFRAEHPQLRSLAEIQSERDEMEAEVA